MDEFATNIIGRLDRTSQRPIPVPNLPDPVRRFILTSVASVPHLEAMLLLRSESAEPWSAARVARRLYIREAEALPLLHALNEAGIAAPAEAGQYRYAPAPELAALLDQVADTYASNLLGVTQLIHSRIDRRAQQFADAFRLKKQGDES
jgi:hypothetical protein